MGVAESVGGTMMEFLDILQTQSIDLAIDLALDSVFTAVVTPIVTGFFTTLIAAIQGQVRSGLTVTIPDGAGILRRGYSFRGWAMSSGASQPTHRAGARVILTRTKVLYAPWRHQLSTSTP